MGHEFVEDFQGAVVRTFGVLCYVIKSFRIKKTIASPLGAVLRLVVSQRSSYRAMCSLEWVGFTGLYGSCVISVLRITPRFRYRKPA